MKRALVERPGPGRLLLAGLYAAGAGLYHAAYDRGWRRPATLPRPVLSVGNLAAGGTGKTPVVGLLLSEAGRRGLRPAVLTRGYRARLRGVELRGGLVEGRAVDAAEAGDEPLLLSRAHPGVPILVDPDRAGAARRFLAAGGTADLFLLDDGFQHRALARDADLVLLDAARPFGNARRLPAGPLREPPPALRRATALLLTGAGETDAAARDALDAAAPGVPRFRLCPGPATLRDPRDPERSPGAHGACVVLLTGIARPERVAEGLHAAGAVVAEHRRAPDHHPFTAPEVRAVEEAARRAGARPATTAKDWVRLEDAADPEAGWLVVGLSLAVEEGMDTLWDTLVPAS